jgi:uncharacterized protein YjaG (DUF416 family)
MSSTGKLASHIFIEDFNLNFSARWEKRQTFVPQVEGLNLFGIVPHIDRPHFGTD